MLKVYKYSLDDEPDYLVFDLPKGAQILTVSTQFNKAYFWALIDDNADEVEYRHFRFVETGRDFEEDKAYYYHGTAMFDDGAYILHLFEILGGNK